MFRKCFAFYATISTETVNRDFDTSAIDSLRFDKIRRELFPVLRRKENFKLDERKQQAKDYIADLMKLTEREQEYMDRFIAKEYVAELLFDDEKIMELAESIKSNGIIQPLFLRKDKDEYIIGKKKELVDGWIANQRMVSRIHAKIVRVNNRFFIIDEESDSFIYIPAVFVSHVCTNQYGSCVDYRAQRLVF